MLTTADGSNTLKRGDQESFHSQHGAVAEANHVFIQASGLAHCLDQHRPTRILEVGFGSGLNFLLSADLAMAQRGALHYVGLECELVTAETFRALAHAQWLVHPSIAKALEQHLSVSTTPTPRPSLHHSGVVLDIVLGDAASAPWPERQFEIVFHDAFSPATSPTLWTDSFLKQLMSALVPGGVLVTYCAKGEVRRAFTAAGFAVDRLPGPPRKREMLRVHAAA